MKDSASDPDARRLFVLSEDPGIDLADTFGSANDPTVNGATVRVVASAGDAFDTTYVLPAANWRYLSKKGVLKGYRYRNAGSGPIHTVVLRDGAFVRIGGAGSGLMHSLGGDPGAVTVVIGLGERRYCMSFGGRTSFQRNRRFRATGAPAPSECPASSSESG